MSSSLKPESSIQDEKSTSFYISIPSNRRNISQVESFLKSIPQFNTLSEAMYYNVLIALTEAVNNAIIHGNKLDETKNAEVTAIISSTTLKLLVRDYGIGFNPDAVPDPRNEENLLREGGRGVFLIMSLIPDSKYTRMDVGMLLEMNIPLT